MNYARIALAVAQEDVSAAADTGSNVRSCPSFTAKLSIFDKFVSGAPTGGTLRPTTETFTAFNPTLNEYSNGDYVQLGQMVDETWVILAGGSGAAVSRSGTEAVIFSIIDESGVAEAASAHCDDQLRDAATSYTANVLWRPCGSTRVSEETDEGTIVVYDRLGSFLANRENSEVGGKRGVALYMREVNGYDCEWVIIFIDWWREIQVIEDVIHTDAEIRFKVKKVQVWDDCDLDDIVIPLVDCADTSG